MSTENQPVATRSAALEHYLKRMVRLWLGVPAGSSAAIPPMPAHIRDRFLRVEEFSSSVRNVRGNWEHSFSQSYHEGTLWQPELDLWLREARIALAKDYALQPLWPQRKEFAACFTHDIDRVSNKYTFAQLMRSARTDLIPSSEQQTQSRSIALALSAARLALGVCKRSSTAPSLADTIERSASLEREVGVRASYFFTVYPVRRRSAYDCTYTPEDKCTFRGKRCTVASVMRALADDGHDIGLHGSFMSPFDASILTGEKNRIERALGRPISTTRQHYLHWDARTTPRKQVEAGFSADTTLGYSRNLGFRSGTGLPYMWFDLDSDTELSLLEIPLVVQDTALISHTALNLPRDITFAVIKKLIDRVREAGSLITFLFHPDRLAVPAMYDLFSFVVRYCVENGAWTPSVSELQHWWEQRAQLLANS